MQRLQKYVDAWPLADTIAQRLKNSSAKYRKTEAVKTSTIKAARGAIKGIEAAIVTSPRRTQSSVSATPPILLCVVSNLRYRVILIEGVHQSHVSQ